jgi:hypothetical protein
MKQIFWCALVVLGGIFSAEAQKIQVPESWDRLASKADEVDNVTLDKNMLQLASKFIKDDNEQDSAEVNRIISKLDGIYVRHLEFKKEGEFSDADVEPIRNQLAGPEWSRVVEVKEKESKENVAVYIRSLNGKTTGLVVVAEEPMELTFVHLDGEINPEDIGSLSGNFGIPNTLAAASQARTSAQKGKEKPNNSVKNATEVKK